ncbi:MAG: hypothetical protein U1E36_06715 [Rickettsiales bacterium]
MKRFTDFFMRRAGNLQKPGVYSGYLVRDIYPAYHESESTKVRIQMFAKKFLPMPLVDAVRRIL